jgi:multiple sugar transport system substrate-binding protein
MAGKTAWGGFGQNLTEMRKCMKTKKMVLVMLVAAIVVCGFAACSKSGQSQSAKSGKIKAAVWDASVAVYYAELVDAFTASHPGTSVEMIDIPAADYTQKLSVMLNGGSDIDVFWIKDGDTTKGLANRGQLADLNGYVQRDNINLAEYNGLAERFNINGKLLALPASSAYYVLFYNKDLFDKAGQPYPSNDLTWAEYEQLALRMTSGSGGSKVYGGHFHTWPACVQNWAIQDGKNTIVANDYGFMRPYYEMVLRLQDAGAVMEFGSLKAGNIAYGNAFLKENIATMPMGFWFASTLKERIEKGETNIKWGVATLPHPESVPAGWTVGSVTPIVINQASRNKDVAWEFIKFVTSDEGAKIHARHAVFPSRTSSENLAELANIPGMPEGMLDALVAKNIALDRPMEDYVAAINQMLTEEHSLIMLKETTVEKGLAAMAKRAQEIQGK